MSSTSSNKLPWVGLLALAMAGFIAIMTETLPAGLLPQIKDGLHISESMAGQLVTAYGIGSLVAAIPLALATSGWRRRPLLLVTILCFLIFNTVTALSSNYVLTLVARFFCGVAAGVLWGMIAGYALRMVPEQLKGRGMAVALVGTPIALSFGVPVGTLLASIMSWRLIFGIMSLLSIVLIGGVLWKVPDYPGQASGKRISISKVLFTPGVSSILFVIFTWMLAHNILYTYIAPFLTKSGLEQYVGLILLVFGLASLIGLWVIGVLIDRWLRLLVLISLASFAATSLVLAIAGSYSIVIFLSVALWGLTFGGAATLLQTALAQAAGEEAVDIAMPMSATVWNLAIAGGGILGGIILDTLGVTFIPWTLLIIILLALLVAWGAKKHGFRSIRR
ncbi:MFS transporter [Bacillus cereus group sp. TH152-1LC]|uniref:MFS transporter n=1 Tax=Bacillus cereus group sp. TH152-1LC TaxID=3018060 RepID=UPI0022E386F8|nr:MFS transporter [Bacillus cereus group sp. TH152-1LC]MDA1680477.1 MFS transporter [Bacillus cereus group sp. TH152-1LC]